MQIGKETNVLGERLLKSVSFSDGYSVELVEISDSGLVTEFEVTTTDSNTASRGVIFGQSVTAKFTSFADAIAYFTCSSEAKALPACREG